MNTEDRINELINRVYRTTTVQEPFHSLGNRIRNRLACAKITTDEQLLDCVSDGTLGTWKGFGPDTVRKVCEYLAQKFPTDPPRPR
jgi:hypothetical protein